MNTPEKFILVEVDHNDADLSWNEYDTEAEGRTALDKSDRKCILIRGTIVTFET